MKAITVRRVEAKDTEAVCEIYKNPKAYSGTLQLPHPSLAIWEKRCSNLPDNVHAFVALVDDEIVGNLGFTVATNPRRRHVADIGMAVKDCYQGQGVGSALLNTAIDLADNWLNLKRIELTVYSDNAAAVGLYKKFGFVVEGEAKAYAYRNGKYVDALYMARIKPC